MKFIGGEFEIRRTDPYRRGYADAVSEVLDLWSRAGMLSEDEYRGNPDTLEGVNRYGRWLLWWTSTGYVRAERCASALEARQGIAGLWAEADECPDEVLETWLWQAVAYESASDEEPQRAEYHATIEDIPEHDRSDIATYWLGFLARAEPLIEQYEAEHAEEHGQSIWARDFGQICHDWVLTSYRHGAGFWDRYSGDQPYATLGRELTELAHQHSCPEVSFRSPDGWWIS